METYKIFTNTLEIQFLKVLNSSSYELYITGNEIHIYIDNIRAIVFHAEISTLKEFKEKVDKLYYNYGNYLLNGERIGFLDFAKYKIYNIGDLVFLNQISFSNFDLRNNEEDIILYSEIILDIYCFEKEHYLIFNILFGNIYPKTLIY